jgi:hypothetical protein
MKDQLLASKDVQMASAAASSTALLACKDELLATRTAELQQCKEQLLQYKATTSGPRAATADSTKRQRLHTSSIAESPLLERDDILDHVFSFAGGGDHLYIGGVSRRWRGRYIHYCAQEYSAGSNGTLLTRQQCTNDRKQTPASS